MILRAITFTEKNLIVFSSEFLLILNTKSGKKTHHPKIPKNYSIDTSPPGQIEKGVGPGLSEPAIFLGGKFYDSHVSNGNKTLTWRFYWILI